MRKSSLYFNIILYFSSLVLAQAEELHFKTAYLSLREPSSFGAQFWVRLTNDGFTPIPMFEKIQSSQILVDGQPMKRGEAPFHGPVGLPIKSAWEGCLPLSDYAPEGLPPGTHRIQLQMGESRSEEFRIRVYPKEPVATDPAKRMHQVEALDEVITPGLLRRCVENWLVEQDGGLQSLGGVHYYVDPGVKVLVSYQHAQPEPVVKNRIKVYLESRIGD